MTKTSVKSSVYSALKAVRASQPFNWIATTSVRGALRAVGSQSEKVIKHLHRVGDVCERLPNGRLLRLWSRGDDWISNQVFWRGWSGYEPETVPLFFDLARRASVTLDVGAYVGYFSLLAGHANLDGRVFAFEPMPANFQRLEQNIRLNQLTNVECSHCAVADADGEAEFFHSSSGLALSSSLSRPFMGYGDHVISTKTPVVRLDSFAARAGIRRVDLLKIDTESTEPDVLRGMSEILARDRPNIICEVLKGRGSEESLERILRPMGYRFYLLTPAGADLRERIEGHPLWLNYFFSVHGIDEIESSRLQGAHCDVSKG